MQFSANVDLWHPTAQPINRSILLGWGGVIKLMTKKEIQEVTIQNTH